MCPRRYDSTRRRAQTAETRLEVLEAARALIGGKGDLRDFSMEAVAEKAGVARMTVYHQFGSRAGLLEGLADHLARRGGMAQLREAFLEPDPEKAVRRFVETFVGFWASDPLTMRRLRAMAVVAPAEDRGPRERDSWRLEGAANLLDKIGRSSRRDLALAPQEALEFLAALTSFEMYDALSGSGRAPSTVAKILADAAVKVLDLDRSARARPRGARSDR